MRQLFNTCTVDFNAYRQNMSNDFSNLLTKHNIIQNEPINFFSYSNKDRLTPKYYERLL